MATLTDSTIKDFATAVRFELRDLPKETIDELAGELEAALSERQQDEGESFTLGSPKDFAAELREAAGVQAKPKRLRDYSVTSILGAIEKICRRGPVSESLFEFGISIRPLWWIARAFIAWLFVWGYRDFFTTRESVAILGIFALVSIQWGRKKWFSKKYLAATLLPLNILAMLLAPVSGLMIQQRIEWASGASDMLQQWPATDGLRLNGVSLTEIKAVDASGKQVTGLHFLDSEGNDLLNPSVPTHQFEIIPDLKGMTLLEAQAVLTPLGFQNVDITNLGNSNDQDSVVKTTLPAAGETMDIQGTITIYLDKK
jgi:hypothetical protein